MTRTHSTLLIAGAIIVASAAMFGFRAGQTRAAPTSVATLSLFQVMAGLNGFKDLEAEIDAERQQYLTEHQNAVKELNRLEEEFRDLPMSEDEKIEALARIDEQQRTVEAINSRSTFILTVKRNSRVIKLYEDIANATAAIAKEQGYDLVLVRSDPRGMGKFAPLPLRAQSEQLQLEMLARPMIYVNDATVDITTQLIQRMNNDRNINP